MTHQDNHTRKTHSALTDILSDEETHPGLLRQLANGIGGLLVLLLTGLVLIAMVFWKSPSG